MLIGKLLCGLTAPSITGFGGHPTRFSRSQGVTAGTSTTPILARLGRHGPRAWPSPLCAVLPHLATAVDHATVPAERPLAQARVAPLTAAARLRQGEEKAVVPAYLGVPLNGDHELVIIELNCLDRPVIRPGGGREPGAQPFDRLVVVARYPEGVAS